MLRTASDRNLARHNVLLGRLPLAPMVKRWPVAVKTRRIAVKDVETPSNVIAPCQGAYDVVQSIAFSPVNLPGQCCAQ